MTHFHVNAHAYVDKIFSAVLFSVYYVMFFALTISNPCSTLLILISISSFHRQERLEMLAAKFDRKVSNNKSSSKFVTSNFRV